MRNGYILLHRQGLTEDEWKHPLRTLAWIDLLTLAAWDEYTTPDGVPLKRGELIASETFLAKRWRQNRGTVHRWLLYWETQRMVQRVVHHQSQQLPQRLFVVNYAKYQGDAQRPPQQVEKQLPQRPPQTMKRREEKEEIQKEKKEEGSAGENGSAPIPAADRERRFKELLVQQGWCDQPYAEKTWDQGMAMSERAEFVRKVNLMLGWARIPSKLEKARLLYHEIAAFVNDRGAMQQRLTPQEAEARKVFREETGQELEAA